MTDANIVIAKAKFTAARDTLLNWDHDVTPTSEEDLMANIRSHISPYLGLASYRVVVEDTILSIAGKNKLDWIEQILIYDLQSDETRYGRVSATGLRPHHLKEIAQVMGVVK